MIFSILNHLYARQQLLEANSENERLSAHYIQLSWDEIDRLSTTTIYRNRKKVRLICLTFFYRMLMIFNLTNNPN